LLFPVCANAGQFYDGNRIHLLCSQPGQTGLIAMYTVGVTDKSDAMMDTVSNWAVRTKHLDTTELAGLLRASGNLICLPDRARPSQLGDVVCKYVKENPARRADGGDKIVLDALEQSFPCK
jgi:hypothetical protein